MSIDGPGCREDLDKVSIDGLGCRDRIPGDGVHLWTWTISPQRIPRNMAIKMGLWNVCVEMTRGMCNRRTFANLTVDIENVTVDVNLGNCLWMIYLVKRLSISTWKLHYKESSNTVDLVNFACLNFHEFLILGFFTKFRICEFLFFSSSAIIIIIFAWF